MSAPDITPYLPPSLRLPPHLSAHKYFFVCTLTVAAWDSLVLSPRTWRLFRTPEWPALKIIYHILRFVMPAEFIVVAVAFFDTNWSNQRCQNFHLFEPITTAILLTLCAVVHSVRVSAIFDRSTAVLSGMLVGTLVMASAMGVGSAFHHAMPLEEGQGCISGPKHTWVGIYWIASAAFFVLSFALALTRSMQSVSVKPLGWWKLMLRDGLNLYGSIALVQLVNVVFFFVSKPTGKEDTIRTIVTSMCAVLTTTMTLRIILSVRGSLASGGAYAGVSTTGGSSRAGTTHVITTRGAGDRSGGMHHTQSMARPPNGGFSLEEMRGKPEREWDGSSSRDEDGKDQLPMGISPAPAGVKVHVERETVAVDSPYANYYKS
ncbi:hypothetical protein BKA62DRAFT_738933 [Auriculariales sp. MPI-PUGE-AT-0066]|nr:hypothetical protein BKA62DRAFT_738933 [Auriculariales sp. MPI-PUGE-AT-0066]